MTWNGPVPDEYAARFANVVNAFADSPHAEAVQPEVWDADRIRQRWGRLLREGHVRGYSIAALWEGTGEMAALTEVTIDPQVPQWGRQRLTAVTRPHRGHRRGLLVKTAMMRWLAERSRGWSGSRPGTPWPTITCSRSTRRWATRWSTQLEVLRDARPRHG